MKFNALQYRAYALGYYDGRTYGSPVTMGTEFTAEESSLYRMGYDAGVTDYCELDMNEVE